MKTNETLGGSSVAGGAARSVAQRFVAARQNAEALPDFPGPIPADLEAAYRHQDEAIAAWPAPIAGWKIGRIAPHLAVALGADRLAGPIFRGSVAWVTGDEETPFPVFQGGFAAIEAEFVIELARDVPPDARDWSAEAAADLIGELRAGIETAGSPLATINELGPAVVVSDFGNNHGLIVGPPIAEWRTRSFASMKSASFVEGTRVGEGGAASLPGGPIGALCFLLGLAARRGVALKAGDLVSTGATTGIHDIRAGERGSAVFDGAIELRCRAVPARGLG
jgi:2-keto-4-pentenoate hydratase